MDRRTFVLLTGATSGALIRPPVRPTHSPTGAGWRSGGRAAGVWVEAELLTAGGASTPQASVTVTVFPDRYLPTVRGVRFFQLPHADVLAGDGPLTALVNGAHSADPTRVVTVGAPEAEG